MYNFLSIKFGEIEVSSLAFAAIIVLSLFTFIAVGISSFNLVSSAIKPNRESK